jgi:hypothetical protein
VTERERERERETEVLKRRVVLNLLVLGLVVATAQIRGVWREVYPVWKREEEAVCSRARCKCTKLKCASHSSEWGTNRAFSWYIPMVQFDFSGLSTSTNIATSATLESRWLPMVRSSVPDNASPWGQDLTQSNQIQAPIHVEVPKALLPQAGTRGQSQS